MLTFTGEKSFYVEPTRAVRIHTRLPDDGLVL